MNHFESEMSQYMDEMVTISALDDMEEQGYLTAPYICKVYGLDSEQLLESVMRKSHQHYGDDFKRDIGAIRWCINQRHHCELRSIK
jgi:hypothetical protein